MMKAQSKRRLTLSLLGAVALSAGVISTGVFAGNHGGMPGMMYGGEKMIERMIQHLDLNEAQQKQIWAIYDESHPVLREKRGQVRKMREAIANAIEAGDRSVVQRLSKELGREMGDMVAVQSEMRLSINSVLTDQQRAEAKAMREKMHERFRKERRQKIEK